MNWKPTNEFRFLQVPMNSFRQSAAGIKPHEYATKYLVLQQKWECLVEPEHDGATGYIAEEWRDVPTVTEESK